MVLSFITHGIISNSSRRLDESWLSYLSSLSLATKLPTGVRSEIVRDDLHGRDL